MCDLGPMLPIDIVTRFKTLFMVIPQLLKVHWFIRMCVKEGRRSEKKTKLYLPSIPFTENRYFLSVQHKLTTICLAATLERPLYVSILVYFAYICVKSAFSKRILFAFG